jgi:hypothetical protein
VLYFKEGVFDEYDYWAGTVGLVVFALFEIILFAWVFGMDKGWKEITTGSDIRVPLAYRFVIKYITPVFIAAVFLASLPGIWEKITAKGLPWQVHGARALLLTMFLTICWFVRVAYLKRVANLKSPKA